MNRDLPFSGSRPLYADFRAEINRLYPLLSRRIAIRDQASDNNLPAFRHDLGDQIAGHILHNMRDETMNEYQQGFYDFAARNPGGSFVTPFYESYPDHRHKEGQAACFTYIYLADHKPLIEELFLLSSQEVPSLCMKFQAAAMRPDYYEWFRFFHELGHALIQMNIHDSRDPSIYAQSSGEMLCDAFASLHLLRKFGSDAIPILKTVADMRLSKFKTQGDHYFTAPAIRAAIENFENKKWGCPR